MKHEPGRKHPELNSCTREQLIEELEKLQGHVKCLEKFCRSQKCPDQAATPAEESSGHLLEQSFDAVVIHANGKIVYVNRACSRLLGARTPEELVGKSVLDIVHPDYHNIVQDRIDSASYCDVKPAIEEKFVTLDGRTIDTEVIALKISYQGRPAIKMVFRDITRRKQLEEKLLLTQFTLDRAADMIFWVAPDGHFTYVNIAACRVLGYTREELLTMAVFDMSTLHNKENWEEHRQELKQHESVTFENTFIAKDGHRIPVELSVNYLSFGGQEYNCASVRDITERKRAEEELKTAKSQAELYLDLMGHDINNMHQIALGYLEMAKDMQADPAGNEFLDKPIEVLQRSARLIQNVRKLQKLQEGVFMTDTVEVRNMLASIQREFGAVPGKTIALNLNCSEPCYVRANDLLHDVFANLVSNAIKHTGVRADISITLDRVRENSHIYYRISVDDNGPGIPEDFKGIIFNRILKGTDNAKGMGLGLYLVKSLVDSYGGKVWVEDRVPGDHRQGAKFVVLLPAVNDR
jgi:PAS domain S-box-containing protein